MRKVQTTITLLASMLIASTAMAQPGSEAPAEESAASETEATPEAGVDNNSPFPRISDDEETIFAVQRKAFLMNKKVEISVSPAFTFTDRFVQTYGGAGAIGYHLAENFAVELFGVGLIPDESALTDEILRGEKLTPEVAKLTQMLGGVGIGAQWSPIYGKIEIFDDALGNFSFYVGAGVGMGWTRVSCTPATLLDPEVFGQGTACEIIMASDNPEDAYKVVYENQDPDVSTRKELMGVLSGGVRFSF